MKKICAVMITGILVLLMNIQASAQTGMPTTKDSVIAPYTLAVTYYKTTNLVFPYAIKSVDRGSKDILAQKAKGVENVLQVKAAIDSFVQTNLTVITTDGNLYSFTVGYSDTPMHLNIVFQKQGTTKIEFSEQKDHTQELCDLSKKVMEKKKTFLHRKEKHGDMKLKLVSLHISNDVFYFKFFINNKSNVSYDIDAIKFALKDKQKARRTASQETELKPLYYYGETETVPGKHQQYFVVAVPKLTLPDNKYLDVHIIEKGGGRDLQLKLKNIHIMKAKPII